jgi:hypothetical protein
MVVWAICLVSTGEAVTGRLYNVYDESDTSFLIELSPDYYKNFDKKYFIPDSDPVFGKLLTFANIKGVLEWEKEP